MRHIEQRVRVYLSSVECLRLSMVLAIAFASVAAMWNGLTLVSLGEPHLGFWIAGAGAMMFLFVAQVET